jgi:hypothetical protein
VRAIHDDIFGLHHILGHHVRYAEFFPRSQVGIVINGTGNVENAEMWASRARDLYLENLNGKVLIVDTCTWADAHIFFRHLNLFSSLVFHE